MFVDSLASARSRSSNAVRPDSGAAVAAGFVVLYLLLDWVSVEISRWLLGSLTPNATRHEADTSRALAVQLVDLPALYSVGLQFLVVLLHGGFQTTV